MVTINIGGGDRRSAGREVAAVQLRGWMAVPAILVALLFVGSRAMSARDTFAGPEGEQLRLHLWGEYNAALNPAFDAARASGEAAVLDEVAEAVVRPEGIEFVDVGVKGHGNEVVARVEIAVDGGVPPDGKRVRYFLLRHRLGRWDVARETGAFGYYSKLF